MPLKSLYLAELHCASFQAEPLNLTDDLEVAYLGDPGPVSYL